MKKGALIIVLFCCCLLFFISCGNNESEQSENALNAYSDVLQNKMEFINTDGHGGVNQSIDIEELLNGNEKYKITKFALLDMDGDKTPELIFQYCTVEGNTPAGDTPDFVEVLKYHDGIIYGLNRTYREMAHIKTDGSYSWSYSGFDNGYSKLDFESESIKIVSLGYCQSGNENQTEYYFVNDKAVSSEEYTSFCESQNQKTDITWHDYTTQNIKEYFKVTESPNPDDTEIKSDAAEIPETDANSHSSIADKQEYLDLLFDAGAKDKFRTLEVKELPYNRFDADGYYEAWDEQLNKIYGLLAEKLSAEDMNNLQVVQRQWLKTRDENALAAKEHITDEAMAKSAYTEALTESTKRRTYELIDIYFPKEDGNEEIIYAGAMKAYGACIAK